MPRKKHTEKIFSVFSVCFFPWLRLSYHGQLFRALWRKQQKPLPDAGHYALPSALRTLSGVAGDSTHLPIALWMAMMTRCVFAREWLIPLPP